MEQNIEKQNTKRRSTFAVLFYINRTKIRKDGMCQLLCKVSIDAEWAQIGTKVSVNPAIWNPEKGRADGRSENAVTVNRAIDDLTSEIAGHYDRIKNSLGFITAELVKNAVKGIGQKPLTLLALFREHNEEFKKRVGIDRIRETYESYQRSYKHLSAFVREKKGMEDVTLRSLDRVFYDDFEVFLRTDRNLKPKSVHEHLYRLKKLTVRAVSQGTLRRDPYCRLHPELPKRRSRHMKLEDLKTLMTTPVEKPQLQFVRDMFIFSTFTGLAYADLKKLSVNDITQADDGTWWIHIHRQKTDTLSSVFSGIPFAETEEGKTTAKMTVSLDGFFGVRAKSGAELLLIGDYDVPIYARWRLGKGMVGSFMCDLSGEWSFNFLNGDGSGVAFILNVVSGLMPTESVRENEISVTVKQDNYTNSLSIFTNLGEGETITGELLNLTDPAATPLPLGSATVAAEGTRLSELDCFITSALDASSNYSRCRFVIKKGGIYRLTLKKVNADGETLAEYQTHRTFSYSEEYDMTETDVDFKQTFTDLSKNSNGSAVEDLKDLSSIFESFVTRLSLLIRPKIRHTIAPWPDIAKHYRTRTFSKSATIYYYRKANSVSYYLLTKPNNS